LNVHIYAGLEAKLAELISGAGVHTISEILSEPATWKSCLEIMERTAELQSLSEKLPRNIEWVFVGCGSSFYLAQVAAATWSILTG
jgi:glucosamine--fructose-6-phosphate aminotransferase (isomerizing)